MKSDNDGNRGRTKPLFWILRKNFTSLSVEPERTFAKTEALLRAKKG